MSSQLAIAYPVCGFKINWDTGCIQCQIPRKHTCYCDVSQCDLTISQEFGTVYCHYIVMVTYNLHDQICMQAMTMIILFIIIINVVIMWQR